MNTPPTNPSAANENVDWMILNDAVAYLNGKYIDTTWLISYLDANTLDFCSESFQRRLFEELAEDDPSETLYRVSLYINRPYGQDILRKAALKAPNIAAEIMEWNPNDPIYRDLTYFLSDRLGKGVMEKEITSLRTSFWRKLVLNLN